MRWSWKLCRVAGIAVHVHVTFVLLLVWTGLSRGLAGGSLAAGAAALAWDLVLFSVVVLHELGHALAARRYGIRTRDITLLPIGGVARLERMPDDPWQEFVVALAGPSVNVVLAALATLAIVSIDAVPLGAVGSVLARGEGFLGSFVVTNLALGVFNLLPAFPMDGGRVLRAILQSRLEPVRATRLAAKVGQALAVVMGIVGILANPLLVLIALFVWTGAAQESALVERRHALGSLPVEAAMASDFRTLAPDEPLASAARHLTAGFQHDFPVVHEGRLVGLLTRADLVGALARQGAEAPVASAMQRAFLVAAPHDPLEDVVARLEEGRWPSLPVIADGRVVGIVTPERIAELIGLAAALRAHAARAGTGGTRPA